VTPPSRQLLVFGFDANAAFEGQLVGALERMESGGALRILDVLFVAADEATGELIAIDLQGSTGGLTAKLLDFRLDPAGRRRKGTSELARDLGAALQPGTALAAVLVEHIWSRVLDDAVSRVGGRSLAIEFVDASTLSELGADLLRAAT
jgi:exoribonuclease R